MWKNRTPGGLLVTLYISIFRSLARKKLVIVLIGLYLLVTSRSQVPIITTDSINTCLVILYTFIIYNIIPILNCNYYNIIGSFLVFSMPFQYFDSMWIGQIIFIRLRWTDIEVWTIYSQEDNDYSRLLYLNNLTFSWPMLVSRRPTSGSSPSPWRATSSSVSGRRLERLHR